MPTDLLCNNVGIIGSLVNQYSNDFEFKHAKWTPCKDFGQVVDAHLSVTKKYIIIRTWVSLEVNGKSCDTLVLCPGSWNFVHSRLKDWTAGNEPLPAFQIGKGVLQVVYNRPT